MSAKDDDDDDVEEVRRQLADKLLTSLSLSPVRILVRLEYGKGFDCLTSDKVLFSGSVIAEEVLLSEAISLNGILDDALGAFDFASFSKGDFLTAILDARRVVDRSLIVVSTSSSFMDKAIKDCCISVPKFCC